MQSDPSAVGGADATDQSVLPTVAPVAVDPAATAS